MLSAPASPPAAAMAVLHVNLADPAACRQVLELSSQAWHDLNGQPVSARALKWLASLERLPAPAGMQVGRQTGFDHVERVIALHEQLKEGACLPCTALAVWSHNVRYTGCPACKAQAPARAGPPAPSLDELHSRLAAVGYTPRRPELLALLAALSRRGPRVFLLEGQPGTGKTFLAESWARVLGIPCNYLLCHSWLSAEDLQSTISVSAAVRGAADQVDQPGFLCEVARHSQAGPVAAVLDEVDKAPERVENLLLDFLQNGRVPGPRGLEQANPDNLWIFITSNGIRPLGHALLRRCCRLRLEPLPDSVEFPLLLAQVPGLNPRVVAKLVELAGQLRKAGHSCPSLHELARCSADLHAVHTRLNGALTAADLQSMLGSWLAKEPEEEELLRKASQDVLRLLHE